MFLYLFATIFGWLVECECSGEEKETGRCYVLLLPSSPVGPHLPMFYLVAISSSQRRGARGDGTCIYVGRLPGFGYVGHGRTKERIFSLPTV
ncbi:hypothetical protein F5X98DRAFT_339360 [Xylaria grammica]|nr:hypothetical protein F5X98DRAFT_339360 [Xylaria grammica]